MTAETYDDLNIEDIAQLGALLARQLHPGDTLLLAGEIGAGKSFLARSMIQSRMAQFGAIEDVPSPTFTLVQTYLVGQEEIWHADLYRLDDPAEIEELGLLAAFDSAICLIEWPEVLGQNTPKDALSMTLTVTSDTRRSLTLEAARPKWDALRANIKKLFTII